MTDTETQSSEAEEPSRSIIRKMGKWVLVAFVLLMIALFVLPGFVEYRREQSLNQRVYQVAESIRAALANYTDIHPSHRYPDNIGNYQVLRDLVNKHGGSLPGSSFDADIARISYTSDDGSDYELIITLDVPDTVHKGRFQRVTPEGVARYRVIPK